MSAAQTTDPATGASVIRWDIDPAHTTVAFGVRHMMVSTVRGEFQKVSGAVTFDRQRLDTAEIVVSVDVASISTRDAQRDAHLRSADFFDVESFPTIEFRSRGGARKRGEAIELSGELTIHGVTRVVLLQVEELTEQYADPWGFVRIGAHAKGKIRRSDFGMVWNTFLEAGGVVVGDDVTLQIDVELQRKP